MSYKFKGKKILITGAAGFIGYHLSKRLLQEGAVVLGVDNMNDYYDPRLKRMRLGELSKLSGFSFSECDISDKDGFSKAFEAYGPEIVINLAAQAGVRCSANCPEAYIQSNIVGFFNVLELCRRNPVKHLVFASSSSVYGANSKVPFSVDDRTDEPVSLYAATKKSDELLAYSYSSLYSIPATGLRFFTVYGPYGRPDMAYFKFAEKIWAGEEIEVYNRGNMYRDFTYVDDIVEGVVRVIPLIPEKEGNRAAFRVYNIGGGQPVKLMDMIETLERALGKKAKMRFLGMQPGDVPTTFADTKGLEEATGFVPSTGIEKGLASFADWYKNVWVLNLK
jgi:UDP-glucuronate 4-epimerase